MKTREQLTLPSGGVCMVRRFSMFDLRELPSLPAAFTEPKPDAPATAPSTEEVKYGSDMARIALLRCCSPILLATGEKRTIVAKAFHDCADGEISVDEVDTADALAIVNKVSELSGLGKEAAVAVRPFPAQPKSPAAD